MATFNFPPRSDWSILGVGRVVSRHYLSLYGVNKDEGPFCPRRHVARPPAARRKEGVIKKARFV